MANEKLAPKRIKDSYTEHIQILNLSSMNGFNRLFGGQLMEWIDIVAAIVARRHSGHNVTTAAIDNLQFLAPAHANDTILLTGNITFAGTTSMEVCVNAYVESLGGTRELINTAYVVLVALDENEKPVPVPELILETEEEKEMWEAAKKRRDYRKLRNKECF